MSDLSMNTKLVLGGIGFFIIVMITMIFLPFTIIRAGERGVVMKLGKVQNYVLNEGIHFRTPLQDEIKSINVKTLTTSIEGAAGSSDSQFVNFKAKINWHMNANNVNETYQTIGDEHDVEKNYIENKGPDAIKAAISKTTAIDFQKNREKVRVLAIEYLKKRIGRVAAIEDISFTDIDFSKEFNDAVEAKVTAEQKARKAENDLERIKFEAKQKIETAQAEAESIRIQTEALSQNQNLIELRKAEALLESAKKGQKIVPDTVLGDSGNLFFSIK